MAALVEAVEPRKISISTSDACVPADDSTQSQASQNHLRVVGRQDAEQIERTSRRDRSRKRHR